VPRAPERNLVGDFLVGPFQRVPADETYTLDASQRAYEELLGDLQNFRGRSVHRR
jgi:hypothetical protein